MNRTQAEITNKYNYKQNLPPLKTSAITHDTHNLHFLYVLLNQQALLNLHLRYREPKFQDLIQKKRFLQVLLFYFFLLLSFIRVFN